MRIDNPISSNAQITGSFTGSFKGDGTLLTGVTAEWDGSHNGNGSITGSLNVSSNIVVGGTVDGRDLATDGIKLDGIEASATADQTGAEIKTAYEGETDTNAFDDAAVTKLANIEASATADQSAAEILSAILTVDGAGSGLDADLLDGQSAAYYGTATAVDLKADIASPTFTGVVTITTAASNDNSTKAASTAFVQTEISDLIGGAGAAFDTLLEISASIANGDSDVVALTTTVSGKLQKDQNLSDLTDAGSARTNLGIAGGTVGHFLKHDGTFGLPAYTVDTDTTYTGGTGITLTGTSFAIGQAVATTSDVTFNTVTATGNITAYSDARLKTDVKTIEGALNKTNNLRGVEYTRIADNSKSIGVIAQELEAIIPELVLTDSEGMKSVNYSQLTGLLIEAVKELSAKVDQLTK